MSAQARRVLNAARQAAIMRSTMIAQSVAHVLCCLSIASSSSLCQLREEGRECSALQQDSERLELELSSSPVPPRPLKVCEVQDMQILRGQSSRAYPAL